MENNLTKIEEELKIHYKKFGTDIEAIFNVGVKIGRELELNKLPDYRLDFFKNLENLENIQEKIRTTKREVADLILQQIHNAVKEIISDGTSWTVGVTSYHRNDGKFSDEIVKKYCVRFLSVEQPQTHGHFDTHFEITGRLGKTFEKYGFSNRIEVTLDNDSGEDNMSIYSEDDVESFYSPSLNFRVEPTQEGLENLIKFKESILKNLMFQIIDKSAN
jgi:hypothetical protein